MGKGGETRRGSRGGGRHVRTNGLVSLIEKLVDRSSGRGKGKGKRRAAPLKSQFWERKLEQENRQVLGAKTYTGTIRRYNFKFGYGWIMPDNPGAMPNKVKKKLEEQQAELEKKGKDIESPELLYFRKPDVNHEDGFKLEADVPCSFKVYVDERGAGACEVSMA